MASNPNCASSCLAKLPLFPSPSSARSRSTRSWRSSDTPGLWRQLAVSLHKENGDRSHRTSPSTRYPLPLYTPNLSILPPLPTSPHKSPSIRDEFLPFFSSLPASCLFSLLCWDLLKRIQKDLSVLYKSNSIKLPLQNLPATHTDSRQKGQRPFQAPKAFTEVLGPRVPSSLSVLLCAFGDAPRKRQHSSHCPVIIPPNMVIISLSCTPNSKNLKSRYHICSYLPGF